MAFGVFAFLFFVARLVIYPFYLLWSVLFEYPVVISHSPAWWIMVILLFILQVYTLLVLCVSDSTPSMSQGMHVYWFVLIYQMTKTLLTDKSLEGDIRSEPEFTPLIYEDPTSLSESALTPQSSLQSVSNYSSRKKQY